MNKTINIGGASGFWGDAARATPQLLNDERVEYLVYDYLAEITMSIMARARAKDASKGYAIDFITSAMTPHLKQIEHQGVRVISNAGGVNPRACAEVLTAIVEEQGLNLKIACITGDDLFEQKAHLSRCDIVEMFSAAPFPPADSIQSINAYLGAFPIARALALGADIVVTGRVVDSALTLAACIYAFEWRVDNYDKLASGSLAGHLLECGPQLTGGNFTDWHLVADQIDTLGYPIATIDSDGVFVCSKAKDTGGLVTVATVAEQLLYEIGDPGAYLLPDVSCDFSQVKLEQTGREHVKVSNAKGRPPSEKFKVSVCFADEYRGGALMTYYGIDADKKARAQAAAIFRATRRELRTLNWPDFSETSVEIIGAESQYGDYKKIKSAREVVLKIAAKHPRSQAIGLLLKETVALGLATPPGLSGFQAGRPRPSPVVRLFSFLMNKNDVPIQIEMQGICETAMEEHREAQPVALPPAIPFPMQTANRLSHTVPLIDLAWARSGDKGDKVNVGVIARDPSYLPFISDALTHECIALRFAHFLAGSSIVEQCDNIELFFLPGINALNVLMHNVLGGGGIASLRNDPQGKGFAQLILDVPIPVTQDITNHLHNTAHDTLQSVDEEFV